ncbi:MAG: PKD domain-containing protein [Bacteroidota bacterium]
MHSASRALGFPTDIQVSYTGFSAAEEAAFQYAVDIWANELFSNFPIEIEARFQALSGGLLASTTPVLVTGVAGPVAGAAYPIAYANALTGCDIEPLSADMVVIINSSLTWHTDPNTSPGVGEYDLATVALHEIAHGLGISTSFEYDDGAAPDECPAGVATSGCYNSTLSVFDHFLETGVGIGLPSITNNSVSLGSAIRSNSVVWNGAIAVVANGSVKPSIEDPVTFVTGESICHLDEVVYPAGDVNSLMTPSLNMAEAIHDPGPILRGMLKDMGWNLTDAASAFFTVQPVVFSGQLQSFFDRSSQAVSWEWDFDNNGSVESTAQNPGYIYPTSGTFTAKLTINGSPALTHLVTVEVFDKPTIPYFNDFDAGSGGFFSASVTCDQWELGLATTSNMVSWQGGAIGGSGQSWTTNLTSNHGADTRYYVQTPSFDLVGGTGDYFLRFDYFWVASNTAGMNVQYSTDGGNSWSVLGGLQGTDPDADANWYNTASIANLDNEDGWQHFPSTAIYGVSYKINSLVGFSDVRFRLKFGAGSGITFDGIQIDNFQIQGAVLDAEAEEAPQPEELVSSFSLGPNPSSDKVTLSFRESGATFGQLRLYTTTGQSVFYKKWRFENEMEEELSIAFLPTGVYVYEWFDGKNVRRGKILKQ